MNVRIVTGCLIAKDGKYLLVQEAREDVRGKWNLPAGRLELDETIFDAAIREAREETGCEVELVKLCQVANQKSKDGLFLATIFVAKLIRENVTPINPAETLDVKWYSYEEILAMKDQLRNPDFILGAIENYQNGLIAPLDIVSLI